MIWLQKTLLSFTLEKYIINALYSNCKVKILQTEIRNYIKYLN